MTVLSRVNLLSQQRVDLNHLLAMESFAAYDFRTLISAFTGSSKAYILRGFDVVGKTGLTLSVRVRNSLVFNPADGVGSFYVGAPNDADVLVNLPADQQNIFIQARFVSVTGAPISGSFWDPLALQGDDVAGSEFAASANSQTSIQLVIEANTTGFDADAIDIARVSTSASSIISMRNSKNSMFRLGSGGSNPAPLNKFPWSTTRAEPVGDGTGVGNEVDSPFRSRDATGVRNDYGIESMKEWMDAVMTRIAEIAGQAIWYDNSAASAAISGLTLQSLFFDTIGHNIQSDKDTALTWKRDGGNLVLASQGVNSVKWQSNYTGLQWELGASFTNNIPGGSRSYSDVKFTSPSPVNGGNIYLLLEREVTKGSGNSLMWASNSADPNLDEQRSVSGVAGDFAGIAIGDYIRKESEGFLRYYRVVRMSDGTTITNTADFVADNTITGVELDRIIIGTPTSEPLKYFRAKYSNADIYADSVVGEYQYQDVAYYWLGRNVNDQFFLRDYGTMQEGEEVTILNDSHDVGQAGADGGLILEHGFNSLYDGEYKQVAGTGQMLTIRRRKRDNTVPVPGGGSNADALITYTLASPVGALTPGQSLWVKLSDSAGGALTSGSVTDPTDDQNNTNTNTNVWEVRDQADTPLRTFDNRDVFLVARCVTITDNDGNPVDVLVFTDGSVLGEEGNVINNALWVNGRARFHSDGVHLMTRPNTSVLFIDDTETGRIDDDVANFFYDKTNEVFGAFNYRIGPNYIDTSSPADQNWMASLGAHRVNFGDASSTLRILGNLEVLGAVTSFQVNTVQSDDKLVTLGVGNLDNASGGSGIEVADNTVDIDEATSVIGQDYIDFVYLSPHGYVLGQTFGVSSTMDVGGITSGAITGEYTVVGSVTLPGQAEIINPTTIRIMTLMTATSSETVSTNPPSETIRTFDVESWIKLTNASGVTSGLTSWAVKVKGESQIVTATPVSDYGILPTAHSANMIATRIPFVDPDGAGPVADSTLNFDGLFTWDAAGSVLRTGHIYPSADDTYDFGHADYRWAIGRFADAGVSITDGTEELLSSFVAGVATVSATTALNLHSDVSVSLVADTETVVTAQANGALLFVPRTGVAPVGSGEVYFDSAVSKPLFSDAHGFRDFDGSADSYNLNGIVDRTQSDLSFDNGTRTFTLSTAETFYYIGGTRYRIVAPVTTTIPNVSGKYLILLTSSGTLINSTIDYKDAYMQYAIVATIYWSASTAELVFLSDHRHELSMGMSTKEYLRKTSGIAYISGIDVTATTGGGGFSNAHAQISLTSGEIVDRDIDIGVVDDSAPSNPFEQVLSPVARIPVLRRDGASGEVIIHSTEDFPLAYNASVPLYNLFSMGTWSAAPVPATSFFVSWIVATNNTEAPIMAVMPQSTHATEEEASSVLFSSLDLGDLDRKSITLLYRLVFRTDPIMTNTPHADLVSVKDYRMSGFGSDGSSSSQHNDLDGLTVGDPHTQYAYLPGRVGGQVLVGGTAASNNLVLRSTTNGLKGQVWVDENTPSTTPTSGALRVTGGVGINENLNVGGIAAAAVLRITAHQTISLSTTLTTTSCLCLVSTTTAIADIAITLPASTPGNRGQMIILKDTGLSLSTLNKRAFIVPQPGGVIISTEIHTNAAPFLWDVPGSSITLIASGGGAWYII